MSNRETYSEIRETLSALGAPPGDTIAERIEGLLRERTDAAARAVVAEREKLDAMQSGHDLELDGVALDDRTAEGLAASVRVHNARRSAL